MTCQQASSWLSPIPLYRLLMISLMSSAVGQARHHHHRELSPLIGLQWMQRSISPKWTAELSWLGIRSLHHPDIQLMVCYLNSVPVVHFMLRWNHCWTVVQTELCPAATHLQLWSLIDTKSLAAVFKGEHKEREGRGWLLCRALGFGPSRYICVLWIWCGHKGE